MISLEQAPQEIDPQNEDYRRIVEEILPADKKLKDLPVEEQEKIAQLARWQYNSEQAEKNPLGFEEIPENK